MSEDMFCAIKVKKTAVLAVLLVCVLVGAAVPVLARQAEAGAEKRTDQMGGLQHPFRTAEKRHGAGYRNPWRGRPPPCGLDRDTGLFGYEIRQGISPVPKRRPGSCAGKDRERPDRGISGEGLKYYSYYSRSLPCRAGRVRGEYEGDGKRLGKKVRPEGVFPYCENLSLQRL